MPSEGRTPLQCNELSTPPKPGEIVDVYSLVLGDVFHAMNRAYVPVKHVAKKSYFVALQNAFFVWNESKFCKLRRKMIDNGLSTDEVEMMQYFNSQVFLSCVDRVVPAPSILYWRVRAVFALYGPMIDSGTGKPLFTKKSWKKADGVLNELLQGLYSDPLGISMYTKKVEE
jgi:hypothetical protein